MRVWVLGAAALTLTACGSSPTSPPASPAPPAVALSALTLQATSVVGGQSIGADVQLSSAAPAGGTVVALSSSSASAVVPATVTVPAGSSAASFVIATAAVSSEITASISASAGGQTRGAALRVEAVSVAAPVLQALAVSESVLGGQPAQGTVTLDLPAPAGGTAVALSSNDSYAIVPPSVLVEAGSRTGAFAITTRETNQSFTVTITAALGGHSRSAPLRLDPPPLPPLETFFRFVSEPGDYIGQGQTKNLTPANGSFEASVHCQRGLLTVHIRHAGGNPWSVEMEAPFGSELRPGTYNNATRWPFNPTTTPGLSVSGEGRGCNQLFGSFVVTEAVYGEDGTIRRFRATFEQRCERTTAPLLSGEISLADVPKYNYYSGCASAR